MSLRCKYCNVSVLSYLMNIDVVFKIYQIPHLLRKWMLKHTLQWCDIRSNECTKTHFLCPPCQVINNLREKEKNEYFYSESDKELPKYLYNPKIRNFYCNACIGWICETCGEDTMGKGGYLCDTCLRGQCEKCIAWTWCQCGRECVCMQCAESLKWIIQCCDCKYILKTVKEFHSLADDSCFVADGGYTCPKCYSRNSIFCDKTRPQKKIKILK